MRFGFNDEQQMFQDAIRGALKSEASNDKIRSWTDNKDISPFNKFINEYGLLGLGHPEDKGGQGGGIIELAILFEELGQTSAPSGRILASNVAALRFVAQLPDKLPYFKSVLLGDSTLALCVNAGKLPNQNNINVTASSETLSGSISLVLNAPESDQLLVPVIEKGGFGLWLVDASTVGVTITERNLIDRTRLYGDITFSNVTAKYLGFISDEAALKVSASIAVMIAAESLGLAKKMLAMTVDYAKQREQFGVLIGSFQAVKHACADIVVDIEAAYSGVYYAAWALDNNTEDALLNAWVIKSFTTEIAVKTADSALKLHGAIGYTWEYDLHYYYKRAKSNLELFGSARCYRDLIANNLPLVKRG